MFLFTSHLVRVDRYDVEPIFGKSMSNWCERVKGGVFVVL